MKIVNKPTSVKFSDLTNAISKSVVKKISAELNRECEASMIEIGNLRQENEKLRVELGELEAHIKALEEGLKDTLLSLHTWREKAFKLDMENSKLRAGFLKPT